MVGIMQYSTNYVFSKINVAYALALFQLSTILSVLLGVNIFREQNLGRKIISSLIMILGAVLIIFR
jgi:drug/metabolite transporter (DMT)-like permease